MGDWVPIIFLMGAAYALALLHRIAGHAAAVNENLADLLAHESVEGYDTDTDPD